MLFEDQNFKSNPLYSSSNQFSNPKSQSQPVFKIMIKIKAQSLYLIWIYFKQNNSQRDQSGLFAQNNLPQYYSQNQKQARQRPIDPTEPTDPRGITNRQNELDRNFQNRIDTNPQNSMY